MYAGKTLDIYVVGILHINGDVPPELAEGVIGAVALYGIIKAENEVLEVLNGKEIINKKKSRKR